MIYFILSEYKKKLIIFGVQEGETQDDSILLRKDIAARTTRVSKIILLKQNFDKFNFK